MNGEGTDEQRAEAKARLAEMFRSKEALPRLRRL